MKIAIDISPTKNAHSGRGIGVYTKNLLEAFSLCAKDHQFIPYTYPDAVPSDVDVVHIPYFEPFFLTLHVPKNIPTVVTVHDLIPLSNPDLFSIGIRGKLKWFVQRAKLHRASRILTDSYASQGEITRLTGISKQKIAVVYPAPHDQYFRKINPADILRIKKKYHITGNYFLYVGDVNANKNIVRLLKAFGGVSGIHATLVLVGRAFLDTHLPESQEIERTIQLLSMGSAVRRLGYVDTGDLCALYKGSTGYLQPSIAEGFGLPPLEAMASGAVVAVSGISSLKEIAGPSYTFDPYSVSDMTDAMKKMMNLSKRERTACIDKNREWASTFSWKKTVHETVSVYAAASSSDKI